MMLWALVMVALVAAGACGDDDTEVVDAGDTTTTTVPGAGTPPGEVPEGWERGEADVGRAEVTVAGTSAVLDAAGSLPTPCHVPVWDVTRDGTRVDVSLASAVEPERVCAQVLEPYEITIPLGEFEVGTTYDVVVNGEAVDDFEI